MSLVVDEPEAKEIRLKDIRELEKKSGPAAAERALVQYLRDNPKSHKGFVALARVLLKQKKYEDALRAADKAREVAPMDPLPLLTLGIILSRMKEHQRAGKAYAEAINIDPTSARAYLGAAYSRFATKEYDAALEILERALKIDPGISRARELKARILMKKGDTAGAEAVLHDLITEDPENDNALKGYLRLMRSENRGEEALQLLKAEAAAYPEDKTRSRRLSKVAIWADRPEIALDNLERDIKQGATGLRLRVGYLMGLIESDRLAEAEAQIAEFDNRKVTAPIAAKFRGDIALKSGDPEGAIQHYRDSCRAARAEPLNPDMETKADSAEAKAHLWQAHNRKLLAGLLRDRREGRKARR